MKQPALTFEQHVDAFRAFLRQQGRPDALLWVHAGTIRGFRTAWCYRPTQSSDPQLAKRHFQRAQVHGFTVRFVSYGTIDLSSIVSVEVPRLEFLDAKPMDSGVVDYSIVLSPIRVCRAVSSKLVWHAIRLYYDGFVKRQSPRIVSLPARHPSEPAQPDKRP